MLEVISKEYRKGSNGKNRTYATCKCDCGNITTVRLDQLKTGNTKSCGCLKLKQDRINLEKNHKHKETGTVLYRRWANMKNRCYSPKNERYANYGGRGIEICDEWLDYTNFRDWAIKSGYNKELTLDRIDVNGNYEPSNCRWVNIKEQCNNRTTNILIEHEGVTYTMMEFCEKFKMDYGTVYHRYKRGDRSFEELTRAKWTKKQYMKIPR